MKTVITFLALATLISCGAAGDPLRPTANLGLSIGPNGITPSANVGAQSGPVSVNIGL